MQDLKFTVFGFPVVVSQGVFVLAGVYLLLGLRGGATPMTVATTLIFVGIIFPSVLLHELGHAASTRYFGLGPAMIELHGMGGTTRRARAGTTWQSIAVTAAGPGAGLMLGLPLLALFIWGPPMPHALAESALVSLIWVNVGWSLLNLMPILPLDGGHLLLSFVSLVSSRWALPVAGTVGLLIAGSATVWAFLADEWFLMVIGGMLAHRNWLVLQSLQTSESGQ